MRPIILTLALLYVVAPSARAEPADATLEVVGVRVISKGFDYDKKWDQYRLLPFNAQSLGTEVALALTYPSGGIIAIDDDNSKMGAFKDDRGTDLLKLDKKPRFGNEPGLGSFPKVSEDGTFALVSIRTPVVPAAGAHELTADGTISLVTGSTRKTAKAENVTLSAGTKLKLDAYAFQVEKTGKPDWGDAEMAVTFKTSTPLDAVIEFTFFTPDGKKLKVDDGGTTTMRFGNMVNIQKEFNFAKAVKGPVNVHLTYWTDMKRVSVPFKITTTIAGR